jgi:hypothetical protein
VCASSLLVKRHTLRDVKLDAFRKLLPSFRKMLPYTNANSDYQLVQLWESPSLVYGDMRVTGGIGVSKRDFIVIA